MNIKKDNGADEADSEHALVFGQFKGKCHNCGKIGHKAANCHLKKDKQEVRSKTIICHHCKKPVHKKSDCFKLKRMLKEKGEEHGLASSTRDVILMSTSGTSEFTGHTWVGDSGASGHYCNNDAGMFDVKSISEEIRIGNGKTMKATKMGKLRCKVLQKNGNSLDVTLSEVKFVPELWILDKPVQYWESIEQWLQDWE
jgi:hypothetical protein